MRMEMLISISDIHGSMRHHQSDFYEERFIICGCGWTYSMGAVIFSGRSVRLRYRTPMWHFTKF